jgi:signal transduction histidine kinase/ligand-binding sensor domain-containing protein
MNAITKLVAVCCALAGASLGAAESHAPDAYALKLWTVEDRLPGSPVLGVAQAGDGYLWLVTRSQLIRFNGAEFAEVAAPDDVLRKTGPWVGVFCGRTRGVWAYGPTGLARFLDGAWRVWCALELGWNAGRVLGVLETPDGVVRAVAERGLLEAVAAADDATTQFAARLCPVPSDDRATLGAVTGASADASGSIWMTAWNGLVEYRGGRFDDQAARLPDFLVEAAGGVHAGRSGRLWVCGSSGVAYRDKTIWTPVGFPENAGMASVMLEVSDGSLWIGNPTGLFRWRQGGWQRIAEQDAPGSLSVNGLAEDRDGTLWAACDGGLLRVRRKTVGTLRAEGAATAGTAYALWRTPDRGTWVGYNGRAVRLTGDEGRLLQTVYLDADVPVSALLQDRAGRVWLGTLGGGLFVEQAGAPTLVTQRDYSLPAVHTVHALLEDAGLGVLVGTPQGLMRVGSGGELEPAAPGGARIAEPVRSLYRDGDGALWVCCERAGVWRLSPDGGKRLIGRAEGLSGDARAVYKDLRGHVWIGTTAGLFALRPDGALREVGRRAGLFDGAVLQIEEDALGRLWLGTTRGLLGVYVDDLLRQLESGDDGAHPLRLLHLGVADGLAGERSMGGVARGGRLAGPLWFPFDNGLAVVVPSNVLFSARPPPVAVERVSVNGETVFDSRQQAPAPMSFAPGARSVAFQFAALSPGLAESARFRYRIDGARQGWSAVQAERSAVFEWLPPGRYALRVIAEAGGAWNTDGAVFDFEVEAFFWQTAWFYLSLAVLLAAGVFLIARWMLWHRYQLQMAMLRREEALAAERARISRDIHDDLGNGLSVVATLSELAHNDVEKGDAHRRLDQIYDVANELARNVDEIVWAVNPANDGWEPFLSYFEQYTEYFLGNSGLRFHFVRPPELVSRAVASKTRHHLLLAVREAVGNVLKHASAKRVSVAMRVIEAGLEVTVEDDGVGFDPARAGGVGHDGLVNMSRRMREAGGCVEIESAPGRGTRVTFRVPLG